MLMAALQYVDVPGYSALLLRRTFADLSLPGALMDRAAQWLQPTAAKWNDREKTWTFPSGATLTFGYLEIDKQKYRYQGSEIQFCGWDELTQFQEPTYTYLFSRLRRLKDSIVPIRMRAASNPGGEGHEWVYERFVVKHGNPDRIFIPAKLGDNPYIDKVEYERSLMELDDTTRQQLLDGAWITDPAGKPFSREWWDKGRNRYYVDDHRQNLQVVARWISFDTALKDEEDSAYSACSVGELLPDYRLRIRRVWRDKLQFPDLPDKIQEMASEYNWDGKLQAVVVEDKASGISAIQTLQRTAPMWLQNILVPFQPAGDKVKRSKQAAVWCKRDCVLHPHPCEETDWLHPFESELYGFPLTMFKDQVDSYAQLILYLENLLAEGHHARQGRP